MKRGAIIGIVVGVVIFLAAVVIFFIFMRPGTNPDGSRENIGEENLVKNASWQAKGVALSGAYGDAEIVNLGEGNGYRMYYSEEPETAGFKGRVYSAVSSDGLTWSDESGVRKEWATFVSVIKLEDGRYRMYFQSAGAIKSALSSDGLTWTDESGTRIDSENSFGLNLENVASPTVIKTGNDYVMVYRGDIAGKYSSEVPNSNTQLLLWAMSNDGLNFEKKGIAIDSRNNEFNGLLDGPEFIQWEDGSARVYFWSYKGVYHVTFDGSFSEETFDYSTNTNPNVKFAPDPPCDPTLAEIDGKWFLYYGQHTKGIYYANLE